MSKLSAKQFWVTNFSNRNVSLADLGFTIRKGRSYNLLDSRHFCYTEEQLLKSAREGSLWHKRKLVKVVAGPPQQVKILKQLSDQPIQIRKRSAVTIEEVEYEELDVSDEQFVHHFMDGEEEY